MLNCDFNRVVEVALRHRCFFVNLLHIFQTLFNNSIHKGLLLAVEM